MPPASTPPALPGSESSGSATTRFSTPTPPLTRCRSSAPVPCFRRLASTAAVCAVLAACTTTPPHGEQLRVARIENAVLPMASSALATGQIETARRLYERLLEFYPESVDARMGLGDVALADREASQAANWYLAAVAYAEAPAQRQAALLAHGRAALAAGDLDAAGTSFGHLIDPRENAPRAEVAWGYNGVGLVNLLAGNPREAVAALEQAVRRAPEEPRFQANLDRALRIVANYRAPETSSAQASTDTRTSTDAAPSGRDSDPAASDDVRVQRPQPAPRPPVSRPETAPPAPVITTPDVVEDELPDVPTPPQVADEPPAEPSLEDLVADSQPSRSTQDRSDAPEEPEPAAPADIEPAVLIDTLPGKPTPEPADIETADLEPADLEPADLEPADLEPADLEPADDAPGEATRGQPDPAVEQQPTLRDPQIAREEPPEMPQVPAGGESGAFVVRTPTGDYLQVGAYAMETRARDEASRLGDVTDLPVRIVDQDTGNLFRVQIGPLPVDGLPIDLADALRIDIDRLHIVERAETQTRSEPEPPDQPPSIAEDDLAFIVEDDLEYVVEDGLAYIEIGTFADYDIAANAASRLEARALPVEVSMESRRGAESRYRVRVGPLAADSLPTNLADTLPVDISRLRSVEPAAPQTRTEPEPPAQPLSVVENGLAYIQIGTFASHEIAAAVAAELETRAFPVELSKVSRGGAAPMYRVRVGPVVPDAVGRTLEALQQP